MFRLLPSATKSRQGNIFTPVCHSVHGGVRGCWGGIRGCGGCAWLPGGRAWLLGAPLSHAMFWLLPSATKLRISNAFTPVCHSVHRGVSASVHSGIRAPPRADTPLWADNPLADTIPGQTPPHRQTSPLADTPHWANTPRQTATAADGTHPTGMHSCR